MTPSDTQRFRLRKRLIEVLKDEHAMTLMESLPPVSWDKLATKDDLAALEERVNVRFNALRSELGAKIDTGLAEVRGEMSAMNARFEVVDARFDAVGDRIDKGIAKVGGESKRDVARQTYVILAGVAAAITPIYIALFTGAAG